MAIIADTDAGSVRHGANYAKSAKKLKGAKNAQRFKARRCSVTSVPVCFKNPSITGVETQRHREHREFVLTLGAKEIEGSKGSKELVRRW